MIISGGKEIFQGIAPTCHAWSCLKEEPFGIVEHIDVNCKTREDWRARKEAPNKELLWGRCTFADKEFDFDDTCE